MAATKYEELRDKWYAKLKKKGFEDIEHPSGMLMTRFRVAPSKGTDFEAIRKYYENARKLSETPALGVYSKTVQKIWRLHSSGMTATAVAEQAKVSLTTVNKYIKLIESNFNLVRTKRG